jgi:hypothetical protein
VKPNDTVPDPVPNDTEPGSARGVSESDRDKIDTDPLWPPTSPVVSPTAPQSPEREDVNWYLEGFRGRPRVHVKRQAESEGRSGAAYDTFAHPAKRLEPDTQPDQAVIVRTSAPISATNADPSPPPTTLMAQGGSLPILPDDRRPLTTVPAARRVHAVKRTANSVALAAALVAVVTIVVVVVTKTRREPQRNPSVPAMTSVLSTSSLAGTSTPTGPATNPPASITQSTAEASGSGPAALSDSLSAPSTPKYPSPSKPAVTASVSGSAAVPSPSSPSAEPKHQDAPHKNDGVRNL